MAIAIDNDASIVTSHAATRRRRSSATKADVNISVIISLATCIAMLSRLIAMPLRQPCRRHIVMSRRGNDDCHCQAFAMVTLSPLHCIEPISSR